MKKTDNNGKNRRQFIKKASIGLFGICLAEHVVGQTQNFAGHGQAILHADYPAIDKGLTYSVVNAAHFDLEKVKTLVTRRPELANAAWDWGFGDFETAIGACSHTGRRDIAEFLMSYGAKPDIFTFAMLGMLNSVQEIIETIPNIQSHRGPHGITLLKHAQNRLANKEISGADRANVVRVIDYLEKLGNANEGALSLPLTQGDKTIFLSDYRYGEGENEIFNVGPYSLDPANFIRITRKGLPGRLLHKIGENMFSPTGAPSVKIVFEIIGNQVVSLMIYEPDPIVKALKQ